MSVTLDSGHGIISTCHFDDMIHEDCLAYMFYSNN